MAFRVLLVSLLCGVGVHAEQVVRVKDGDSLVIDSGGRQVDVRLADIDAPEYRQPRGDEARTVLQSLVEGRDVQLKLVGGDAYRRIVAHVSVDGVDVNAEMVRRGLAWVRRGYQPAPFLVQQEDEARAAQRGLWGDANSTPPWVWRREQRRGGNAARPATRAGTATATPAAPRTRTSVAQATVPQVRCGTKRFCRDMRTCGEALAFLRQCGVASMDGDEDGVPCEKDLCRR